MNEGPFVAFYPSDWLAGTRGLTAAETGVYITLVAMMYERGEPLTMDAARLARMCGLPKASFSRAIQTLQDEGKIETFDGGYWNNRVSVELKRRQNIRDTASKAAKTRWGKTQQKQRSNDADAMPTQCGNDANQNHNQIDTVAKATDGQAVDARNAAVWKRGAPFLIENGVPEKQAKSLLGKWLRDHGSGAVYDALSDAKKAGTGDPVPYITEILKPKADLDALFKEAEAIRR